MAETDIAYSGTHRRRQRGPAAIGLNLTAMIDVVFLLLIYFIVATDFKQGEEIYRLDLPQRGVAADPFELPREPLRVIIASTGGPAAEAYSIRVPGAKVQPGSFQELRDYLVENLRTASTVGGLYEADHPIIIQPSVTTTWEHAIEAFNAAVRARYTNITFAKPT